jgi:hypothetical protein
MTTAQETEEGYGKRRSEMAVIVTETKAKAKA